MNCKVDVLYPCLRAAPNDSLFAVMGMLNYSQKQGVDIGFRINGNALVHRVRNQGVAEAREDFDYLLFCDDDMLPDADSLCRLLAHQAPIVSALCTTRREPIELAARAYDPVSDQFAPLDRIRVQQLVTDIGREKKLAVGAAFLLIRRDTIETLKEYYLSARDWLEDRRREMDRMHVRAEYREKERQRKEEIRRAHFARAKILRIFDFLVGDDEVQLGEDISLSKRLLKLGIPMAIDTACQVAHIGEKAYGVWDLIPQWRQQDAEREAAA